VSVPTFNVERAKLGRTLAVPVGKDYDHYENGSNYCQNQYEEALAPPEIWVALVVHFASTLHFFTPLDLLHRAPSEARRVGVLCVVSVAMITTVLKT